MSFGMVRPCCFLLEIVSVISDWNGPATAAAEANLPVSAAEGVPVSWLFDIMEREGSFEGKKKRLRVKLGIPVQWKMVVDEGVWRIDGLSSERMC